MVVQLVVVDAEMGTLFSIAWALVMPGAFGATGAGEFMLVAASAGIPALAELKARIKSAD